jgi:sugar phosphate permease
VGAEIGAERPGTLRAGASGRELGRYPEDRVRYAQLALVAAATITVWWQGDVAGAVAPLLLPDLGMSFSFFLTMISILAGLAGIASGLTGLLGRWGRANLMAGGLLVSSALTLVAIPLAQSKWPFVVAYGGQRFVDGIVLVATVALVRDLSPQMSRARAMALWTIGPATAALLVHFTANHTLGVFDTWQSQYVICGIVSTAVALALVCFLRELSPDLRDQRMVRRVDSPVVERRADRGEVSHTDGVSAIRQVLLTPRVIAASLGIGLFLVATLTFTSVLPLMLGAVFGYPADRSNGLLTWSNWATIVALVVAGIASDRLGVRKPFMLVGAACAIAFSIGLLTTLEDPHTSYGTLRVLLMGLGASVAIAYVAWMTSFTETVENLHPSLIVAGIAVWGWIVRLVVMSALLVIPQVVPSMNTLVEKGPAVKAEAARLSAAKAALTTDGKQLAARRLVLEQEGAAIRATLSRLRRAGATPSPAQLAATRARASRLQTRVASLNRQAATLRSRAAALEASAAGLAPRAATVKAAAAAAPQQWERWLWIAVICQALFIPVIFVIKGRWSPRQAREDAREHARAMHRELARLEAEPERQ